VQRRCGVDIIVLPIKMVLLLSKVISMVIEVVVEHNTPPDEYISFIEFIGVEEGGDEVFIRYW